MIRLAVYIGIFILVAGLFEKPVIDSARMASPKKKMTITEVLKKHTDAWMKIPGVIGTGEARRDDKPAVMIFVEKLTKTIQHDIPKSIDGYPVVIQETGVIKAQPH